MNRDTLKTCTNHGCLTRAFPIPDGHVGTNGSCHCGEEMVRNGGRSHLELQRALRERQEAIRNLEWLRGVFVEVAGGWRPEALLRTNDFLERFGR